MIQHIIVAVIAIFLCIIPDRNNRRRKYMLPLGFAIVTIFFAIRYNYGLDYMSYQNMFEVSESSTSWRNDNETLFYMVLNSFNHFYEFVIFFTVIIMTGVYLWIRKYCNEKYYALFFVMFMFMHSMSYTVISAMRSTMAAFVLWVALYFFYVRKKNWIFYTLFIGLASGFHLSVLVFLILPLADFIIQKIKWRSIFIFIVICYIISLLGNIGVFSFITAGDTLLSTYASYNERIQDNTISIFGVLNNSLFLFPTYYICRSKDMLSKNNRELFVLSILFMIIYSLNLDIQNRFSSYIGVFFVIIISIVVGGYKTKTTKYGFEQKLVFVTSSEKWIILTPLLFKVFFDYYKFFLLMSSPLYIGLDGNPLFYHTIFDAPYLP